MRLWLYPAITIMLGACGSVPTQPNTEFDLARVASSASQQNLLKIDSLTQDLLGLDVNIDHSEAQAVAKVAVLYPLALAERYRIVGSPLFHNTAVNLGFRDRGLCVHWAEDLVLELRELQTLSLQFHWGVAYPDGAFALEHSAIIVTAMGAEFNRGIVLDGWRNSGDLFWANVTQDDRYDWERLPSRFTRGKNAPSRYKAATEYP